MEKNEFQALVMPLGNKLFRFASRILANPDAAKDALQEVFIKLWNSRDKLMEFKNLEAFSMTMMKNHCIDKLKGKKNLSISLLHFIDREDEIDSPVKKLEISESCESIKKIIGKLPEQQKMIIQLRDIEGYEYEEIAEILGLNINAVRVNLSRARKTVRDIFIKTTEYGTEKN